MGLSKYRAKRNFKATSEPKGKVRKKEKGKLIFVIQEHHAKRLHYDLRLEADGVLKSWAVPKEPSSTPSVKRLAIHVEDHPYDYKDFEGTIPSGYGAGTVSIWDQGTYSVDGGDRKESEKKILEGLKKGAIHFQLEGEKMKGQFHLIRLKNSEKESWLFFKKGEKGEKTAPLTNLDKIFWPQEKITKGDLIQYYSDISSWMLPHLKDRPESLRRFPDGIEGFSFFQKNLESHPEWIETASIKHKQKIVNYLLIQNKESLLYAANLGCIELHTFFSRIQKLQSPDYLVFDLDPKGASFLKVIQVAQLLHEILDDLKIPNYCKTSGATGLHIAIPMGAKYSYDQVKQFAERIASMALQKAPKICTMERSISKRKGKVYIDCRQNNFGQTLAAPYSVRARPGAPVSTPLHWREVKEGLDPKDYTIHTVFKRVKKWGDLYLPVLGKGITLVDHI